MIVKESEAVTAANRSALKMRELRGFLSKVKSAVNLRGEVSVLLTSDAMIRTLNRDFRKKDKPTDVLSFPVDTEHPSTAPRQSGDLAISLDTARRQAEEHGHSLQVEVKILILHGLLHLAGYDHETDKGQMARKENALRKELDLPTGLIQRGVNTVARKAASKKAGHTR